MGVVNVTPDSFSDGGRFLDPAAAIAQARKLMDEGADLIDLGAESSRPGAAAVVSAEEELRRLLPVLRGLRDRAAVGRHGQARGDARRAGRGRGHDQRHQRACALPARWTRWRPAMPPCA